MVVVITMMMITAVIMMTVMVVVITMMMITAVIMMTVMVVVITMMMITAVIMMTVMVVVNNEDDDHGSDNDDSDGGGDNDDDDHNSDNDDSDGGGDNDDDDNKTVIMMTVVVVMIMVVVGDDNGGGDSDGDDNDTRGKPYKDRILTKPLEPGYGLLGRRSYYAIECESSITRNKRGFLSRTGLCPNPGDNFQKRDIRLNYWGMAVIRQSDEPNPKCSETECDEDSHCDGNHKCCKNYCGAKVCTVSQREPHPCNGFHCPTGQTCRVHLVKCVMPDCPDAEAVNRPTCIPIEELHTKHTDTLGDYQPDTTAELLKNAAAAKEQKEALAYTQQQTAQTPYADAMTGAMQAAMPFTNEQQAYAAPMDPSMATAEMPNVIQTPMDVSNFAAPGQDMTNTLNYETQPAALPAQLDQPQVVAQAPAQ
ncbi:hypothetical protein QZH41_016610 [Actinostola sp. cb2023]|nr:hypothetical protein QZH41_016610 [Actinostola sp. cb2023]